MISSQSLPTVTIASILFPISSLTKNPTHLAMLVDGPHFQATNEGELVFLLSDGDSSRRPVEHEILELEEESGTVRQNYYLRVPLEHPDSHRWRAEIGKYLAPLVLGTAMGRLPWTLADFPQGYVLLLHLVPRKTRSSKPRRDFYLYGSTDVASFASPLEFVKHAKWLMQGAHRTLDTHRSPRCKCKYCNRDDGGDNQSVISGELKRIRARVLAQIDGDEVQDSEDDAEAGAEAKVVIAETATAVAATDQGGHAGGDGN